MNRVELIGRLTKDPELRCTAQNIDVASFTIAINRQFKDKQETDYIQCKAFNKRAELIHKYCKKGDLIAIEGSIRTGKYDKEGQTIYTTDIITENIQFLTKKTEDKQEEPQEKTEDNPMADNVFADFGSKIDLSEDDLPF